MTLVGAVPAGYGTSAGSFALTYEVDAYKTYGVKPIALLDEQETVKLARPWRKSSSVPMATCTTTIPQTFASLFAALNTGSRYAANGVMNVLLGLFEQEASLQYPDSFFFEFNVGGSSGSVYASAVNSLSYAGVLSNAEKSDLLAQYPALLLGYSDSCFQATPKILADALVTILAQIQAGEVPSKSASKWTLNTLALQLQGLHFGFCTRDLVDDEVVALAKEADAALQP